MLHASFFARRDAFKLIVKPALGRRRKKFYAWILSLAKPKSMMLCKFGPLVLSRPTSKSFQRHNRCCENGDRQRFRPSCISLFMKGNLGIPQRAHRTAWVRPTTPQRSDRCHAPMEGEKPSWILLDSQLVTPGLISRDVAWTDGLTKRRAWLASGPHVLQPSGPRMRI